MSSDPLARFVEAQERMYEIALSELRAGCKKSHWMWFIFPQLEGLGHSPTAKHYAIQSHAEAQAYLTHPVLGPRLIACVQATLAHRNKNISAILGTPDDTKYRSCLTLFALCQKSPNVFLDALDAFFHGHQDQRSIQIWQEMS